MIERSSWKLIEPGRPLESASDPLPEPGDGQVLVEVAGCGVCHTDLGFYHGHVRTRAPLPLVLGHEISGTVRAAGPGDEEWIGKDVLVPAVIPCGECDFCRAGRGNICASQTMPGNDADGGFASHVIVTTPGLTPIDSIPDGYALADFAVIADAVTTPLQAIHRAGVTDDDLVIVIGVGGVGGYAVQIAAARGASVIAIDINAERLERLAAYTGATTIDASGMDTKAVRGAVRDAAKQLGFGRHSWKIFECSGTTPGQETAFALLCPAATLAVVGYTHQPVSVRLSNLMAFDASAFGSWGCPPELYPEAVRLVRDGEIDLRPFIRQMPMDQIEEAFALTDAATEPYRIVLTP
jgi:6-hydroxycyclohex-1-ene-1-carbonyl-CoA dehydrogenase